MRKAHAVYPSDHNKPANTNTSKLTKPMQYYNGATQQRVRRESRERARASVAGQRNDEAHTSSQSGVQASVVVHHLINVRTSNLCKPHMSASNKHKARRTNARPIRARRTNTLPMRAHQTNESRARSLRTITNPII